MAGLSSSGAGSGLDPACAAPEDAAAAALSDHGTYLSLFVPVGGMETRLVRRALLRRAFSAELAPSGGAANMQGLPYAACGVGSAWSHLFFCISLHRPAGPLPRRSPACRVHAPSRKSATARPKRCASIRALPYELRYHTSASIRVALPYERYTSNVALPYERYTPSVAISDERYTSGSSGWSSVSASIDDLGATWRRRPRVTSRSRDPLPTEGVLPCLSLFFVLCACLFFQLRGGSGARPFSASFSQGKSSI